MTCNFVHYSLIHLAMNLLAFYLIGTLIESWYGAPQFILIYGLTGVLGNLLPSLARLATGSNPVVHSAGGSVVLMGLIGICAVVGWRARNSRERGLLWHMLMALGLTALLGIVFHYYIDNLGHAGGVLVGLLLGLADRRFLRNRSRPSAWGMGVLTSLVIAACGLAQFAADRREAPARRELAARRAVIGHETANRALRTVALLGESRVDVRVFLASLQNVADLLDRGTTSEDYRRTWNLGVAARSRALSEDEKHELELRLGHLASELLEIVQPVLDRGTTRTDYRRLKALAAPARTRELTDAEKAEFKRLAGALGGQVRRELEARVRELWKERRGSPGAQGQTASVQAGPGRPTPSSILQPGLRP
jgi:hypothetical protein